ncbi:MAG TPA: DUF2339 domain-containing protein [Gemmatimonadales bacterium]|nr:DUF2339 domain-containing protein [Gemmatimonadales bacterium]
MAQLEVIVRQLAAQSGLRAAPPARPATPGPLTAPSHPVTPPPSSLPPPPRAPRGPRPSDWEQWFGQRGLLVVGVLALLATGGFFLNYAFEHGWIPVWLRATGAAVAGVLVASAGDRLALRGLRRYGAALIGAGGGLVYLGIWAAAGPYELVGREVGIGLLALVAAGVAGGAVRHRAEGLGVWALVGAYLAPAFLPAEGAPVEKLLGYLGVVGVSSMALAHRLGWRTTLDTAVLGFFLLPPLFVQDGVESVAGVAYFATGGASALLASADRRWPEARLGALLLPWLAILVIASGDRSDTLRWTALVGGLALATLVWWQHRRPGAFARHDGGAGLDPVETALFVGGPLAPVYLAARARPDALGPWGGLVALALAGLYLASGWGRRTRHLVGMGTALLALAVSGQWDGTAVAVGWGALTLAATAADRLTDQQAARDVGVAVGVAAFLQLFGAALTDRPRGEPAFTGAWALGWYALLVTMAGAAALWRPRPRGSGDHRVSGELLKEGGSVLVLAAVATLLLGGSLELQRLLHEAVPSPGEAALAGQVAMVAYWLVAAVALVLLAPRRAPPGLRAVLLAAAAGLPLLGFFVLFAVATGARPAADPAFRGVWSLGWYAQCVLPALAAQWWPAAPPLPSPLKAARSVLWGAAGAAVLVGGTIELYRFFPTQLARDLAISTFWLLSAAILVRVGFWLGRRAVRAAGLSVAGLAALKVAFYDLAELEALYRVGSFFGLALISLAVAYAYNRRASR